uniref:Uncharacterized protein n=1 Tax=Strigamia maritima TaxID=126957 RepID=T1IUA0_STRMM
MTLQTYNTRGRDVEIRDKISLLEWPPECGALYKKHIQVHRTLTLLKTTSTKHVKDLQLRFTGFIRNMAPTKSHVALLILIISAMTVQSASTEREKRSGISDQRLAELETLLALSKMKGKLVTVPVAFGVIDPDKIGKRNHQYEMPALDDDVERNDEVWLRQFQQRFDQYKKA